MKCRLDLRELEHVAQFLERHRSGLLQQQRQGQNRGPTRVPLGATACKKYDSGRLEPCDMTTTAKISIGIFSPLR